MFSPFLQLSLRASPCLHWTKVDRLVVVILDQSTSMHNMIGEIRSALHQVVSRDGFGAHVRRHFITFTTVAADAPELSQLPNTGGGTTISSAFVRLTELLARHGTPKHLDIVFVSDGEDERCFEEVSALPAPRAESRIFCVGVGPGFPSNFAFRVLVRKYGRGNHLTTPSVIPLETAAEALSAFEALGREVRRVVPAPAPRLADIGPPMSFEELEEAARSAFTACVNSVFVCLGGPDAETGKAERLTVTREALAIMQRLRLIGVATVQLDKRAGRPRVLVISRASGCLATPRSAMEAIEQLTGKLKAVLDQVEREAILSQDEKRNLVGFAVRLGAPPPRIYSPPAAARGEAGMLATLHTLVFGAPASAVTAESVPLMTRARARGAPAHDEVSWGAVKAKFAAARGPARDPGAVRAHNEYLRLWMLRASQDCSPPPAAAGSGRTP